MSVTVRDIMKLLCMKNAEVVAGASGLDKGLAVFRPKSFGFEKEWVPFLEY